jgi:hypothetical protein
MRHFELLVDVATDQLVHRSALAPIQAFSAVTAAAASSTVAGTAPPQVVEWRAVLDAFPEITKRVSGAETPSHGVEHQIITGGRPVTAKFRWLDSQKLAAAKAKFDKMLAAG